MAFRAQHIALLSIVLLSMSALSEIATDSVEGVWLSADGTGWIKIELSSNGPVGSIAGSADESAGRKPSDKDVLNPDPALQDRLLLGLTIMGGFTGAGDGKWKNGRIYDPNSGKTYRCKLTVIDEDTLELRGYIGFSLLGRTETWTRRK